MNKELVNYKMKCQVIVVTSRGSQGTASIYKINKSQACNAQHSDCSKYVHLKVAERVVLKILITRKKCNCMMTDVNQTFGGDHCDIYTNIKSLYCTSETNTILDVNYTSIKNKQQ